MSILKNTTTFVLLIVILFSSCLNAKKLDNYIATQYPGVNQPSKKKAIEGISITSPLVSGDLASASKTETKLRLPLIVYWSWDYKHTCVLNSSIALKNFTSAVNGMANRALKQKLAGRTLQLSLEQVPVTFAILDRAHLILPGVGWEIISVKSEEMDMIVSYKVMNENGPDKTGKISISPGNDKRYLSTWQSWKKATGNYMEQYEANITRMSKLAVEQLMKEI